MEPTQARPSEWESRSGEPVVLQWVMDTRKLWPEAKVPRDLETVVSYLSDAPGHPLHLLLLALLGHCSNAPLCRLPLRFWLCEAWTPEVLEAARIHMGDVQNCRARPSEYAQASMKHTRLQPLPTTTPSRDLPTRSRVHGFEGNGSELGP